MNDCGATPSNRSGLWGLSTLLALAAFLPWPAGAERLIACATTLSATGEAARVYLHSVEMDRDEAVLPGGEILPDRTLLGPIVLSPDAREALAVSGPAGRDASAIIAARTCVAVLRTAPFSLAPNGRYWGSSGWRQTAACFVADPQGDAAWLAVAEAGPESEDASSGRLMAARRNGGAPDAEPEVWPLPGAPVAVTTLDGARVAVLCRGPSGFGAVLHVRNLATGAAELDAFEMTDAQDSLAGYPSGLCLDSSGRCLFVLTSGLSLDRPGGECASWVRVADAASLRVSGAALELPGVARAEDRPAQAAGEGACWIATAEPGAEFGYVLRVRADAAGLVKEIETPFTEVSRAPRIAPMEGDEAAVGAGRRVTLWRTGKRAAQSHEFEGPIGVLCRGEKGLYAAEGGRIHLLDPATLAVVRTVQLQTGQVTAAAAIPGAALPHPDADADGITDEEEVRRETSPVLPDTDGDGISDASDPEPLVASPRLLLPDAIVFRGEAVGRELRALLLDAPHGQRSPWSIVCDAAAPPWLRVFPASGAGLPEVSYLWVDPVAYAPGEADLGTIRVSADGTRPGIPAFGSPTEIEVAVAPRHSGIRRILWVLSENQAGGTLRGFEDSQKLGALADLLAGPPLYFTHEEAGPLVERLDGYAVVVVDAGAAAGGVFTGQVVLDYVSRGGALLFLGRYIQNQETWAVAHWLSPVGILINTGTKVEGPFSSATTAAPGRYWQAIPIGDGCGIRADKEATQVGSPDQAILAARSYGYGRVAALASRSPLESAALAASGNRRFARELFGWLAQAGRDYADRDGDGLTDDIEDRNQNGQCDAGETDFLKPDTDGDGISDGIEDANRNGSVDPGETDPLNPDSDGDGIWDGADVWPLPPADAPQLAAIEPREGPAEGGTPVLILGRNLTPGTSFWFGPRRARVLGHLDDARVRVRTPRYDGNAGDSVDVRARNGASGLEGTLPKAFRYHERTRVRLTLRVLEAAASQYGVYEGAVKAAIECPPDITFDTVVFRIVTRPDKGVEWLPGAAPLPAANRILTVLPQAAGVSVQARGGRGAAELATIPWRFAVGEARPETLVFTFDRVQVTVTGGQPLDAEIQDAQLRLLPNAQRPHRE